MPRTPSRSRLRDVARSALGRVPGPVRARLLGVFGSRLGLGGGEIGVVSVVVVPEDGDRVEDCLASIRAQTHALLDVVVSPVGSGVTDLPDDPRFRALAPEATAYAAVRAGVAAATGRYVVLVRGCDQLLPRAVTDLAGSLATSGSDVATGVLEQAGEPEPWLARAQADSHGDPAPARPASPALAGDLTLANKAFTRAFADRLELTAADDWLCAPSLAALLPWLAVDVLDRPVVRFAPERGHRAYGARPSPLPELEHWLDLDRAVSAALQRSPLAAGWRRHWYDVLLPRFVMDAERADEDTWLRLTALTALPDDVDLRASSRGLLTLASGGRRSDVENLAAELESLGEDLPTELVDGRPVAVWRSVELSADDRRLAESETGLTVRVVRARDSDQGRVVDLWARIGGVDLAEHPLELTVEADGTSAPVEPRVDHTADRWAGTRFQSAAEGAARVTVPAGTRELRVEGRVGGLVRSAYAGLPPRTAEHDGPEPVVHGVFLDGDRLVVRLDRPADGLRLRGPGTDIAGESRRDGTVVFATRRDLYGRSVHLATAVYHLERPGGIGAAATWRESLPVETVGDRLPAPRPPRTLRRRRAPPRTTTRGRRARGVRAAAPPFGVRRGRPTHATGALVLRDLRRAVRDRHPARGPRGGP